MNIEFASTGGMTDIKTLIDDARQRPGYTLAQAFYGGPAVFEADRQAIFKRQWLLLGHVGRIPRKGDYFLAEIAGESIIVVRENDAIVRAF